MADPDTDEVLRLREGAVTWREVDGEVIVLDLRTSEYLGINEAGNLLWRALADGATTAGLAGALVERFGIDPARAEADVGAFLTEARARQLLER
ncbi:PqqD family protein [Modestobacter italicus]|nr:PqqD family protein [Modestobacter marinus]